MSVHRPKRCLEPVDNMQQQRVGQWKRLRCEPCSPAKAAVGAPGAAPCASALHVAPPPPCSQQLSSCGGQRRSTGAACGVEGGGYLYSDEVRTPAAWRSALKGTNFCRLLRRCLRVPCTHPHKSLWAMPFTGACGRRRGSHASGSGRRNGGARGSGGPRSDGA